MKILFVAHRIPYPPDKGDKIRSYQVLKYLASRHEVFLAFLIDDDRDLRAVDELRCLIPNLLYARLHPWRQRLHMLGALASGKPLTVEYFYVRRFRRQLEALLQKEKFDALYVYSSNMAEYVKDVTIPLRLIDYCDVDSEKFKQFANTCRPPSSWLYRLEGKRLAAYEQQATEYFHRVFLINPEEKKLFNAKGASHKIALMSNGVDFAYYNAPAAKALPTALKHSAPYLIFTGAMNYLPNIDAAHWFACDIFPHIKAQMPELKFYIVGGNPVRKIRTLHDPQAGVVVTGYVTDIRPYVKNARVFVAPMRIARGMQTKILEAMACGVPVIASAGAARGIGAQPDEHVLIAETADEYVRQTLGLLANKKLHAQLRKQAFNFLQEKFRWERNLRMLDTLLEKSKSDFFGDSHDSVISKVSMTARRL